MADDSVVTPLRDSRLLEIAFPVSEVIRWIDGHGSIHQRSLGENRRSKQLDFFPLASGCLHRNAAAARNCQASAWPKRQLLAFVSLTER